MLEFLDANLGSRLAGLIVFYLIIGLSAFLSRKFLIKQRLSLPPKELTALLAIYSTAFLITVVAACPFGTRRFWFITLLLLSGVGMLIGFFLVLFSSSEEDSLVGFVVGIVLSITTPPVLWLCVKILGAPAVVVSVLPP